jgi:hypothetical protein
MKTNHVWIVEMKVGENWKPTVTCSLTKEDAEREAGVWKRNNPDDDFRVKWYRAV